MTVVDLSKQAIAERTHEQKLKDASAWARSMQRAFKGVRGGVPRRVRVQQAIEKFDLFPDEQ